MAESVETTRKESTFTEELDKIQERTELKLEKANTRSEKIAVYQDTIQQYQELFNKKQLKKEEKEAINSSISYFQKRIEIFHKSVKERREQIPLSQENNYEITWMDDKRDVYLSNFLVRHPQLSENFSDEIDKITKIENNNEEAMIQKINLYKKLLKTIEAAINQHEQLTEKIRKYQNASDKPKDFDSWVQERKTLGNYHSLKKFRTKFSTMIMGLNDAQRAFERFHEENDRIKKTLLAQLKTGEIKVSDDAPYVMYINKAPHEQYGVIYHYNAKEKKLTLKTYNLVSTGSATNYKDDHTTISGVYYIAQVYNPKVITYIPEDYGTHLVDRDEYAYKNFEFFKEVTDPTTGKTKLEIADYRLHLTKEENKIGTPQSHGCIRVHRIFNRSLAEIYLHQFKRDNVKQQTIAEYEDHGNLDIMRPYFQIPVAVHDFIGDKFSTARAYYNSKVDQYNNSMNTAEKIAFIKELTKMYEEIIKSAEDELEKAQDKDFLAKRYYKEKIQEAKTQISKLEEKHLKRLDSDLTTEKAREKLIVIRKEVEQLPESKVKDMLLKNIDKYLKNHYANINYKIEWNQKLTEFVLKVMKEEERINLIQDPKLRDNLRGKFENYVTTSMETTPLSNEKKMEAYFSKMQEKVPKIRQLIILYIAFTANAEKHKNNEAYQRHADNLFKNIEFVNVDFWISYLKKHLKEL